MLKYHEDQNYTVDYCYSAFIIDFSTYCYIFNEILDIIYTVAHRLWLSVMSAVSQEEHEYFDVLN